MALACGVLIFALGACSDDDDDNGTYKVESMVVDDKEQDEKTTINFTYYDNGNMKTASELMAVPLNNDEDTPSYNSIEFEYSDMNKVAYATLRDLDNNVVGFIQYEYDDVGDLEFMILRNVVDDPDNGVEPGDEQGRFIYRYQATNDTETINVEYREGAPGSQNLVEAWLINYSLTNKESPTSMVNMLYSDSSTPDHTYTIENIVYGSGYNSFYKQPYSYEFLDMFYKYVIESADVTETGTGMEPSKYSLRYDYTFKGRTPLTIMKNKVVGDNKTLLVSYVFSLGN